MIISFNWLRDFVDFPQGAHPQQLALQFTVTTAEVDGVEHVTPGFVGLVAARIDAVEPVTGEAKLQRVRLTAARTYETLSSAPNLSVGDMVMFAPPGATVRGHVVESTDPKGRKAEGMIVAGQGIGLTQIGANAIFLPPDTDPGSNIDSSLFDDWLIEIDNKSITHRPDCWGHYGIAREMAAMLRLPLKPYETTPVEALTNALPPVPIEIDDPALCPRYSALRMTGLRPVPSPLAMQVRLAHCGMRPIDLLVDLTNYVMLELGQPMHAFDGAKICGVRVAAARPGDVFTTLDGVERMLPPDTLMIQTDSENVAIAGVMGGAATEVSAATTTVLLESANFDAPTVRRAATAMGLRTEASARFEKSLDPANTIRAIARFHRLAAQVLPDVGIAGTLSDCYPHPRSPRSIRIDCDFVARVIGKAIPQEEMIRILESIEFQCAADNRFLTVTPPSYRATKDIEIEADIIEEIARFVGYNTIEPTLPTVETRHFEEQPELVLEEKALEFFCIGGGFVEVQSYIWHDDDWLKTIGYEPGDCITLRNPAAEQCSRLRGSLVPGLIRMAEGNRHHYDAFRLVEVGTVFEPGHDTVEASQHRRLGLVLARQGRKSDAVVWKELQGALADWARTSFERTLSFIAASSKAPWEDAVRVATLQMADRTIGRMSIVPLTLRDRIDERLKNWSIAWAELRLDTVVELMGHFERLPAVPKHPQVELDFSVVVDATRRYAAVQEALGDYTHPLLRRLSFIEAYEGGSVPPGKRSMTFRAEIGLGDRTLVDDEIQAFQSSFRKTLESLGLSLRS